MKTTHQAPRHFQRHRDRRYRAPLYPPIARATVTRRRTAYKFPVWWYWLTTMAALGASRVDLLLGLGRWDMTMRRMQILRGIEKSRWQKIDEAFQTWCAAAVYGSTRTETIEHTYTVENPQLARREQLELVALTLISAPRLWAGRERPPRNPNPLPWFRRTFPWTAYRLWGLVWELYVLPLRVRMKLLGPVILKPEQTVGPEPSRWRWTPGIAYMPRAAITLVTAETTLTADPSTGTTLTLATRSGLNQDATLREYLLIQDAEGNKTNREYVYYDGAAGTGPGTITNVTRGQEGTSNVAHGIGSYVVPVLTPTQLKNIKQNATGFFSAKDQYGAKGDNGTDDAAALQAAINAIPLSGWRNGTIRAGLVLIEQGSYVCRTALTLPTTVVNGVYESHVTFAGAGWKATTIRRQNGDANIIFDASGTITAGNVVTRQTGFQLRDLGVNGADATGVMVRTFYHSFPFYDRCYFQSNNGTAIQGVESQEVKLRGSWFDYTGGAVDSNTGGTNVGRESVRILSRDDNATTGTFGYSTDNSNAWWLLMNHFTGINTDVRGQIVISLNGAPSGSQPHRCNFVMNKIEQQEMGGNPIKLFNCNKIRWEDQEYTGYGLHAGSTAVSWIEANNADEVSIRASVFDDSGNNGVSHAALKVTGCDNWTMEDVTINFATAGAEANPAVIADFTGGTNDNFFFSNIRISGTRQTPLYSGTVPVNLYTPLRSYVIVKAADTVLAGTAAQSVGELVFAVGANTTWTIDCLLFIHNAAGNVGGVKVAVSLPASATMKLIATGTAASATTQTVSALSTSGTLSGVAFMTFASTTVGAAFVRITGSIAIAGTAGNVQIQAAEGTNADTNTVELKSFLNALRV